MDKQDGQDVRFYAYIRSSTILYMADVLGASRVALHILYIHVNLKVK